jgi:hypothetical protein
VLQIKDTLLTLSLTGKTSLNTNNSGNLTENKPKILAFAGFLLDRRAASERSQ